MAPAPVGFYALVAGFLSGVFLRSFYFTAPSTILLCALLALALAVVYQQYRESVYRSVVLGSCLFCLAFALGVARQDYAVATLQTSVFDANVGETVTLNGTVVLPPDVRETTQHLYVASEGTRVLVIVDRYSPVSYGDTVSVTGTLTHPDSFTTEFGRTFHYPEYLKARGVTHMVRFPESLTVVGSGGGNLLLHTLYQGKEYFQTSLRSVLPEPFVGLGEGILLGEKRALGEELTEVFRRAGIIHIVVLSGYNVMLVAGFFLFALSFVLSRRGRAIGGIVAISLFALMVGLSPTVVRASLMVGLVLIAFALGREYHVLRALVCAAALMVAINPYLLVYDPGFQLSFLATLGLIAVAPHLETWPLQPGVWPRARALILATIATQVAVLPLLLYQIGEFSVVAVIVNLLVVPMVPVAMLATFCAGVLAAIAPSLGLIAAYPAFLSLWYIVTVATVSASLPFAAFSVPVFSFWYVVLGYLFIGIVYWRYVRWREARAQAVRLDDKQYLSLSGWTIVEEGALTPQQK